VLPPQSPALVEQAKAVAESLRQDAARKIREAQIIDTLVERLEQATFAAKVNHETILESRK
jgi:hypothetical protein